MRTTKMEVISEAMAFHRAMMRFSVTMGQYLNETHGENGEAFDRAHRTIATKYPFSTDFSQEVPADVWAWIENLIENLPER